MDAPHDTPEPDSAGSARHRGVMVCVWAIFFIFIVYPLSLGPVFKWLPSGSLAGRAVEVVYSPIFVLYGQFALVSKFYDWYLHDVWRAPFNNR